MNLKVQVYCMSVDYKYNLIISSFRCSHHCHSWIACCLYNYQIVWGNFCYSASTWTTTTLAAIYMCWFLGYNTPQQMLNYFNVFQVGFAGLRQQPYLSTLFILEQKILTCSITVSSTIYWILKKRRGNAVSTERVYSDSWQCSAANNNIMFTMVAALLLQIIWT